MFTFPVLLVWTDDEGLVLQEIMNGSVDREVYIGHDAQHMRGVLTLKYPIRNGVVRNWDEMEMVSTRGAALCFLYVGVLDVLHVHLGMRAGSLKHSRILKG